MTHTINLMPLNTENVKQATVLAMSVFNYGQSVYSVPLHQQWCLFHIAFSMLQERGNNENQ